MPRHGNCNAAGCGGAGFQAKAGNQRAYDIDGRDNFVRGGRGCGRATAGQSWQGPQGNARTNGGQSIFARSPQSAVEYKKQNKKQKKNCSFSCFWLLRFWGGKWMLRKRNAMLSCFASAQVPVRLLFCSPYYLVLYLSCSLLLPMFFCLFRHVF